MKLIGFVLTAVVAIAAGYADAADLKAAPLAVKAPPAPYVDPYTGFYVGGELGYGFNLGNMVGGDSLVTLGPLSAAPQGFVGGGFIGLGQRFPGFLAGLGLDGYLGIEGNFDGGSINGTAGNPSGFNTTVGASIQNNWLASVRARFGLIYQNVMFFGTAGWGWGSDSFNTNLSSGGSSVTIASASGTQDGFTWGGGVEFPWFFGPQWLTRFEYRQYDFGTMSASCPIATCGTIPTITVSNKDRIDTIMAGLQYRF